MAQDEPTPENHDMDAPTRSGRAKRRRKRPNAQSGASKSESEQGQGKHGRGRRLSKRESLDEEREPRQGWIWLKQNWFIVTCLVLIFLFGLFLRSYYYYTPGTENGYILSGNDPYYHKRVVDYVQENHEHLIFDPLLSYPDGALNPRPPLYDWSVAITGLILSPFAGGDVYVSTWIVMLFAPAFWGALTVFPVYLIGKEMFNKKAGLICAFLVATMPSHVERSPLGFSDHDAIVLFFVVLSFFFFIRALNNLKVRDKWVENWFKPRGIPRGLWEWFRHNQVSVAFAVLAGLSLATIALIWKGFLYPVVIIIVYFFIQMVLNKLRNKDSLGVAIVTIITLAIVAFLPIPYYEGNRMRGVVDPAMEILLAVIIVSAILVPTRDSPWILVFSVLGVVLLCGFLLLMYVFPETGSTYFSGQGYFAKNKVFSTIAEAQAPDYSRAMFSYGVVTTFLALFAIVLSIWRVAKDLKAHYLFLTIWAVTAVYMAISATRFIFNAGPIFAIMSGWMVFAIVVKLDFKKMVKHYRSLKGGGYFYAMKKSVKLRHVVGVLFLAFMIVLPNVWLGWDAGVPYGEKKAVDLAVYEALPGNIHVKNDFLGIDFWVDFKPHEYNSDEAGNRTRYPKGTNIMYNKTNPNDLKYFGAFGHGYPSDYWLDGMRWLSEQDTDLPIDERPGFISWWDYGFWAIYLGQHPTAADNFQGRVQYAGSFISAQDESQGISLLIARLLEADEANYFMEHDKSRLSEGVKGILVEHFGQDRADEIEDVVAHPTRYKKEVLDNPDRYGYYSDDLVAVVTPIYAILQTWIPEFISDEEMTQLYHDLQEETGWSLRYFAIDSRLFPFGVQNTGIFYAPLKLSDHRINDDNEPYDYLRTLVYVDNRWMTLEEFADARETDSSLSPTDYKLEYYEPFLGSMLMKCYIGYTLEDIGAEDPGTGNVAPNLPAVHETNYIPMQGWMMKHFRLVYRTAYWNPYNQTMYKYHSDAWVAMSDNEANDRVELLENDGIDNDKNGVVDDRGEGGVVTSGLKSGVVFLKYYEGAYLSGNVTTYEGTPVPNMRVTLADDYSIPHDSVLTDENGTYNLIMPPGNTTVQLSYGGFGDDQYAPYRVLTQVETTALNTTQINVSDDAAMRRDVDEDGDGIWDYNIVQNFQLEPNFLSGRLFWDSNGDDTHNQGESNITGARVIIYNKDLDVKLDTHTDEFGLYEFDEVLPGEYNISYEVAGHEPVFEAVITFKTGTEETKDIGINPARIQGTLQSHDSDLLANREIQLFDKINESTVITETDEFGNFNYESMVSGNYTISVDIDGYEKYEEDVDLEQGGEALLNITLIPSSKVVGITTNEETGSILANVTVKFEGRRENKDFIKFTTSNETGVYNLNIRNGNYTVSAKHDVGTDTPFRHIGEIVVDGGNLTYDVPLEPGIEVHGVVYFDSNGNGSAEITEIKGGLQLFFSSQAGTLTSTTNSEGFYRIFLPEGNYTVYTRIDTAIVNTTFTILEKLHVSGIDPINYDVLLDNGQVIEGYVFYDRDGDGSRQLSEGLALANLTFTESQGISHETTTDHEGRFSVNLPANGTFSVSVDYPGFDTFFLDDLNISDRTRLREFGMTPKTINVTGKVLYKGLPVGDVEMTFNAAAGMGGVDNAAQSNSTGVYSVDLLPGEYSIIVNYNTTEAGKPVNYLFNSTLDLHVGQESLTLNLDLVKKIKVNGSLAGTSGNVTINFEFVDEPDEEPTLVESQNSSFESWLVPGEYNVWIDEDVNTTAHNVFLETFSFTESQTLQLNATLGTEVAVTTQYEGDAVGDIEVIFSSNGTRTVSRDDNDGTFTIFLPPNRTCDVAVNETLAENGDTVFYIFQGVLNVTDEKITDWDINLTKYVKVTGAVYIDYNNDGDMDPTETMDNITLLFDNITHGITSLTNESGEYEIFLLVDHFYNVTISADFDLMDEARDLTADLGENPVDWDIAPANLTVSGRTLINGTATGSTALWFWAESETATNASIVSGRQTGAFSLSLPLGQYTLYARKIVGSDVYVYLDTFEPKPRESLALDLELSEGLKVNGYAFYINSTGENLSAQTDVEFAGPGIIRTSSLPNGRFELWLPAASYDVTAALKTFEYNMSMDYNYDERIELTEDMNLNVVLEKDKVYDVEIEWVEGVGDTIGRNESTTYTFNITNTGNVKDNYTLSHTGVPDWNITMPEYIVLDVGESANFTVHITAAPEAMVDHGPIQIVAQSHIDAGAEDSAAITVNIEQIFSAANVSLEEEPIIATNNSLIYTIKVQNPGNGKDNFTLTLKDVPEGWNATLGDIEVTINGGGKINTTLTINASYDTTVRDAQIVIIATSGSNGITEWELDVAFTNLVLTEEDLEITGDQVAEGPVDTSTIPGFESLALVAALIGVAFVMKRRRYP